MSIHRAWRVPIDDENMLSYMVNRVPPFDDDMRMKMESSADYDELTRRLMNCEMTLEEVDPGHGLLPVIQDTVSIGGQGAIADRENENLGQFDVGVAMLRRVIERDMTASSEERRQGTECVSTCRSRWSP